MEQRRGVEEGRRCGEGRNVLERSSRELRWGEEEERRRRRWRGSLVTIQEDEVQVVEERRQTRGLQTILE